MLSNAEMLVWKFLASTSLGTWASQSVNWGEVQAQCAIGNEIILARTKKVESSLKSPLSKTCGRSEAYSDW